MQCKRWAWVALIAVVLVAPGCKAAAVAKKIQPAKVDSTEVKGIMRVTLDPRAAERIGLETTKVLEEAPQAGRQGTRWVVPYGALLYDKNGETWTFTNPEPLVFVRHHVVVESVEGDRVILAEGPPAGTLVVTVGAPELMGAEHKYGS